jgi:hypothetical protein
MTFTRFAAFVGALTVALFAVLASPLLGQTVDPLAPLPPPYAAYLPPVPGAINPAVTQANIKTTICKSGWTKTIRPPASYTTKLKKYQMAQWHIAGPTSALEEDHLISLELGGNPTDPNNLWPEPWNGPYGAHKKDRYENFLHREVCAGRMDLAWAQHLITLDWVEGYQAAFGAETK